MPIGTQLQYELAVISCVSHNQDGTRCINVYNLLTQYCKLQSQLTALSRRGAWEVLCAPSWDVIII